MDRVLKTALFVGALVFATQVGTVLAKLEKGANGGSNNVAIAAPAVVQSGSSGGCGGGGSSAGGASSCNMSASTGGSSSCGMSAGSGNTGGTSLKDAEAAGIAYYIAQGGKGEVTAKGQDFGCHVQVDILQNGKTVASYGYQNGKIVS